jgi:hypothetical protein
MKALMEEFPLELEGIPVLQKRQSAAPCQILRKTRRNLHSYESHPALEKDYYLKRLKLCIAKSLTSVTLGLPLYPNSLPIVCLIERWRRLDP